jgi:quinol monooxygenase YgiN
MTVIYAIRIEVNPADEVIWDEWYTRHHIPEVLAEPGFVRATRYKLDTPDGEWGEYLTLYELDSRESLDAYLQGEAVIRLRAAHYKRFGSATRLSRLIMTPTVIVEKPVLDE